MEAVGGVARRVRRVRRIADKIVSHFDQWLEALQGRAMVVRMGRRMCIELYRELARLRPDRNDVDGKGALQR